MKDVINRVETATQLMAKDISYIREKVDKLEKKVDSKFVTKQEFDPVKNEVYNLMSDRTWIVRLVVGMVVTAAASLVIVVW